MNKHKTNFQLFVLPTDRSAMAKFYVLLFKYMTGRCDAIKISSVSSDCCTVKNETDVMLH